MMKLSAASLSWSTVAGRAGLAATVAILLAVTLGGCSDIWTKFTSGFASSDAAGAGTSEADDDNKCQSAGYQYGTPEYSQCRESLQSKRAVVRDIPLGPTSAPTR
jgi:hypothetical protein